MAAKGIQLDDQLGQSERVQERAEHENQLGIGLCFGRAEDFRIDLMELALASFLRAS